MFIRRNFNIISMRLTIEKKFFLFRAALKFAGTVLAL